MSNFMKIANLLKISLVLSIVNYFSVPGKTYFSALYIFFSKVNQEANPKVHEMAFQRQNYFVDEMILNSAN